MSEPAISGDAILAEIPDVIEWMERLDIRARNSRYSRYVKLIDKFFASDDPNSEEGRLRFGILTQSYRECVDVCMVKRAFQHERHPNFIDALEKIVSGRDTPALNEAGVSRDYLFELLVAVRFAGVGWKLCFEFTTDVVAEKDGMRVFAECKRISSTKKLRANMKDAAWQLDAMLATQPAESIGLIFVDVTSCIEADVRKELDHVDLARPELDYQLKRFLAGHGALINELNEEFIGTSLGTCFIAQVPIWTSDGVLHTTATTQVLAAESLSEADFRRLKRVLHGFDKAFERYFVQGAPRVDVPVTLKTTD